MEKIDEVTKMPGFKFWGEDEAEDQELMMYAFIHTFGENWNSKEDEEAFAYLQEEKVTS